MRCRGTCHPYPRTDTPPVPPGTYLKGGRIRYIGTRESILNPGTIDTSWVNGKRVFGWGLGRHGRFVFAGKTTCAETGSEEEKTGVEENP